LACVVTPLVPRRLREKFAAVDARYEVVLLADRALARGESKSQRTRTAVFLARWRAHIEQCKKGALDCWLTGEIPIDVVLRAFDDAVGDGVAPPSGPMPA
jgi:hypothetical protein